MLPAPVITRGAPLRHRRDTGGTPAGLLNSIGLDNDGIDTFVAGHLPYLRTIGCPLIVSVAGTSCEDFTAISKQLNEQEGIAATGLNVSCPNVSGGVDFGSNPEMCHQVVAGVRQATDLPVFAKLTPNVSNIAGVA